MRSKHSIKSFKIFRYVVLFLFSKCINYSGNNENCIGRGLIFCFIMASPHLEIFCPQSVLKQIACACENCESKVNARWSKLNTTSLFFYQFFYILLVFPSLQETLNLFRQEFMLCELEIYPLI